MILCYLEYQKLIFLNGLMYFKFIPSKSLNEILASFRTFGIFIATLYQTIANKKLFNINN